MWINGDFFVEIGRIKRGIVRMFFPAEREREEKTRQKSDEKREIFTKSQKLSTLVNKKHSERAQKILPQRWIFRNACAIIQA